MSSPLAIGAVSAVLRNLLDNGLVDVGSPLGSVKVTAVAPDTITLDDPEAGPSLNIFLYRTSLNPSWRNADLPAFDGGGARKASPPLGLDLHYLVTAYGNADFQAEILLGYAMHLLHERPVLDRASIRRALDPSPLGASILPPAFQALTASDLADQVEAVTVTPESVDTEEASRLWSALQAHYRPSAAYRVSVVLIDASTPSTSPLPVLTRGGLDQTTGRERGVHTEPSLLPPYPTIVGLAPPKQQAAIRLGEQLTVSGHHLAGTSVRLRFAHRLLATPNEITVGNVADPAGFSVTLPDDAAAEQAWPAGVYAVSAVIVPVDDAVERESNVAAVLLAPLPDLGTATFTRDVQHGLIVTVDVAPEVRPEQDVRLALGSRTAVADPRTVPTTAVRFSFARLDAGPTWLRLTVDGVETELVDRTAEPPTFLPSQLVVVPA